MLTLRQLDDIPQSILDIYEKIEIELIEDMAKRIKKLSYLSGTAEYDYMKLQEMNLTHDMIVQKLAKATNLSEKQLEKIFDEAATRSLGFDDAIYKNAGLSPIPLKDNFLMQQIIKAGIEQTLGTFKNFSRTTANTATKQFEDALDHSVMQIVNGTRTYQTAIKDGVKLLTNNGLKVIRYEKTNHTDYIDTAFRRATLTGASQMAGQLQAQRFLEMGGSYVETSAHMGARPDHAEWQGKRFYWSEKAASRNKLGLPDFIQSTGYGTGTGLKGWNCRHDYFPYIEGSTGAYTESLLKRYKDSTVKYNGKELSAYDATQEQRKIERYIKRWKRDYFAMEAIGEDTTQASNKIKKWQATQRSFVEQTGFKRDYFRERGGLQLVQ